jgi:hypothetical protein
MEVFGKAVIASHVLYHEKSSLRADFPRPTRLAKRRVAPPLHPPSGDESAADYALH